MKAKDLLEGKVAVIQSVGKGGKTAMVTILTEGQSVTRHLKLVSRNSFLSPMPTKLGDQKLTIVAFVFTDREGRKYEGETLASAAANLAEAILLVGELPQPKKATAE